MRLASSPSIHKQGLHSRTDVPLPGVCEEATRHALGLHTGQVPGDCRGIYIVSLSLCLLIVCEYVVVWGLVIIKSTSFLQFVH